MPFSIPLPVLKQTTLLLASRLTGLGYAFRGTASLRLQGFDMGVGDIDIACDKDTALALNGVFKEYLIRSIQFSESQKFKSYYGQFKINNVPFEVMGELQIKDAKGNWSDPIGVTAIEVKTISLGGQRIRVTKPEVELKSYALMGRWSAYHKLKKQLSSGG